MSNNKYIVKSLTPWMMDELIAFAELVNFDLILIRKPDEFYKVDLRKLEANGVNIYISPFVYNFPLKKIVIILNFFVLNLSKFDFGYNTVIGIKSMLWFFKMDMNHFSKKSNIHAQFATQATIISFLVKKFYSNKPLVSFTFHAYDIYFKNNWFNLLIKNCHKAFSISEFNIDYVQKKYMVSNKIVLSRLGVFRENIAKNNKMESQNLTLGLMSFFVKKKGIIYLLRAFKKLKESGLENIKLSLAGDGPLKIEILSFIKENNLTKMIKYIGKVRGQEKKDFYNSINVFILPSIKLINDQDGIPVVLMEAIACSLPLISTKVSGIPEICINNFNGILIEERDVQKIYDSIIELYENKEKRLFYSNNSYSLSNEYDISINSKKKLLILNFLKN